MSKRDDSTEVNTLALHPANSQLELPASYIVPEHNLELILSNVLQSVVCQTTKLE